MRIVQSWFNIHKVLIFGFLTAIALPVYDLISKHETDTMTVILAVATAAIAFIGRNMRGKWVTIIGIVGSTIITKFTETHGVGIDWRALVLQILIQAIALATPAPKSIGYEHTDIIQEAKREGEQIEPTVAPPKP